MNKYVLSATLPIPRDQTYPQSSRPWLVLTSNQKEIHYLETQHPDPLLLASQQSSGCSLMNSANCRTKVRPATSDSAETSYPCQCSGSYHHIEVLVQAPGWGPEDPCFRAMLLYGGGLSKNLKSERMKTHPFLFPTCLRQLDRRLEPWLHFHFSVWLGITSLLPLFSLWNKTSKLHCWSSTSLLSVARS
jgi:hypothetical protein